MEQIAWIIGHHYFYWSAVVRTLAAAAACCTFLALYLKTEEKILAALTAVPLALSSSLVLARLAGWYFHPVGTLESAMDLTQPGNTALMGAFAGCFLSACLLRLAGVTKNLPKLLDCMALSGCLGIGLGRLSSCFNASDRGMMVAESLGFPWAADIINPVSGAMEHRFATFLVQAMAAGAIFLILMLLRMKKSRKDGDLCLLFLLLYGASQVILDSTRYDSLHFRSNGFVSAVQVLSAAAMALTVIMFAVRLVLAGGWKKWYVLLWILQAGCFGTAGYMEYYVQRHGGKAAFAYSIMGAVLTVLVLLVLATCHAAAAEEKKHAQWLREITVVNLEESADG